MKSVEDEHICEKETSSSVMTLRLEKKKKIEHSGNFEEFKLSIKF